MNIFRNSLKISVRRYSQQNPWKRTWDVLTNDVTNVQKNNKLNVIPEHADIVIIGGGAIGSSVAYWLKKQCGHGLSVVVLEKDFTYKSSLKNLSFPGITQNYSILENVLMSQYSAEFLRSIKEHLGNEVNLQYTPHGCLVLANLDNAEILEKCVQEQTENGVKNMLLTPEKIKERYPWINVEDIKIGCIGAENEGWFNPWALHSGLIAQSQALGAIYINGEVINMKLVPQQDVLMEGLKAGSYKKIDKVVYKMDDGEERKIKFAYCILASGASSGTVAKMAHIGEGNDMLSVELPIQTRRNKVFCIESNKVIEPHLNTPLIKDINGVWIRKNGLDNTFICGYTPVVYNQEYDDMSCEDLFKNIIEPTLSRRIPDLNDIKVISSHIENYDCNTYDESGIIGRHPYHTNLFLATGFGNQGIEHAPAIGRAICELIVDNDYTTIDLTRFEFDRIFTDTQLIEVNTY